MVDPFPPPAAGTFPRGDGMQGRETCSILKDPDDPLHSEKPQSSRAFGGMGGGWKGAAPRGLATLQATLCMDARKLTVFATGTALRAALFGSYPFPSRSGPFQIEGKPDDIPWEG